MYFSFDLTLQPQLDTNEVISGMLQKMDDDKWVIRSNESQDIQYTGQTEKRKINDLQSLTQTKHLKIEQHEPHTNRR